MKTPDLHAHKNDRDLFIECKRKQKNSEYSLKERQEWGRLARPLFDYIARTRLPIFLDVNFHQELSDFEDQFFVAEVIPKLSEPGIIVDDERVTIRMRRSNIFALRNHLENNYVKANSPLLNYLLYGEYGLSRGVRDLIEAKYWDENPLYIEDVTFAMTSS